jgi:hypothetical protein
LLRFVFDNKDVFA